MARGHEVQVITGFPNYPGGHLYPGYRLRPILREVIDGVPVVRLPLYPSHDRSAFRRVLNYASFGVSAALVAPFVARPADVVYVYHPPGTIGLPALALRYLRRMPLVIDIQDLWPDTLAATGMVRSERLLGLVDRWMRLVYGAAGRIVVLSPGFKQALVNRGVSETKIEVIYNWTEEADVGGGVTTGTASVLEQDCFNVVFAGTAGTAQGLSSVVDAAGLIQDRHPDVRIVLVGGGVERDELKSQVRRMGLSNIVFLPRVPRSQVGGILSAADVLLVHLRNDPLFQITIPGKTQAYFATGRPILMAVAGDAARLVERAEAGISCTPGDPVSIADAVDMLYEMTPAQREEMGRSGRRFYNEELSFDIGVGQFERCLLSVTSRNRRPRLSLLTTQRAAKMVETRDTHDGSSDE
ncbi:MAG: glycosyltransferase family 4 protein [Actinomycetia bacterium]|nr:glycosyltransferase family 4 protein [Actinomycetes bacterium]